LPTQVLIPLCFLLDAHWLLFLCSVPRSPIFWDHILPESFQKDVTAEWLEHIFQLPGSRRLLYALQYSQRHFMGSNIWELSKTRGLTGERFMNVGSMSDFRC
jgi:hypothetical protein